MTVGIACAVGAALASAFATLPNVIAALGARSEAYITAKAKADVALERTRQRTLLIEAGLTHNPDAVIDLLRLQPLDSDVTMIRASASPRSLPPR